MKENPYKSPAEKELQRSSDAQDVNRFDWPLIASVLSILLPFAVIMMLMIMPPIGMRDEPGNWEQLVFLGCILALLLGFILAVTSCIASFRSRSWSTVAVAVLSIAFNGSIIIRIFLPLLPT